MEHRNTWPNSGREPRGSRPRPINSQTQNSGVAQMRNQNVVSDIGGRSNTMPARSNTSQDLNWNMMHQPAVQYNNRNDFVKKHQWKRGMIVNAPVHEKDSHNGKSIVPSDNSRSISAYGTMFTKTRYLIVVGIFERHYQCVPLFTHNSKGLAGKEHYQHEFVSIRDGRLPQQLFKPLSNQRPLVTDGTGPEIDPLSLVHLSHAISRNYNLKVNYCASLTEASTKQLLAMIQKENNRRLGL